MRLDPAREELCLARRKKRLCSFYHTRESIAREDVTAAWESRLCALAVDGNEGRRKREEKSARHRDRLEMTAKRERPYTRIPCRQPKSYVATRHEMKRIYRKDRTEPTNAAPL